MKVLETRVYRGPNLYALWPVLRLRLDLEELEEDEGLIESWKPRFRR